jgi:hypothetical protein
MNYSDVGAVMRHRRPPAEAQQTGSALGKRDSPPKKTSSPHHGSYCASEAVKLEVYAYQGRGISGMNARQMKGRQSAPVTWGVDAIR